MIFAPIHETLTQRGAALVTALLIMLALMIVAVSAARAALHAEKTARGERDHTMAFQAAEAALADAERDIEGGIDPGSARAALFARNSVQGFERDCGAEPNTNVGLCLRTEAPETPAWQSAALSRPGQGQLRSVELGRFTGAAMPVGRGTLALRLPRYIIELMPLALAGTDAADRAGNFYRITAIGFGASESSHVVLQSYYLKAVEEAP